MEPLLQPALQIAGIGMISLAVGSLAIPLKLGWREEVAPLRPLTRHVFWTYAGYICGSHLLFGILAVFASSQLTAGGVLPALVNSYIALWWGVRLVLQFFCFDRDAGKNIACAGAVEALLVAAFVFFAAVFTTAALFNLNVKP